MKKFKGILPVLKELLISGILVAIIFVICSFISHANGSEIASKGKLIVGDVVFDCSDFERLNEAIIQGKQEAYEEGKKHSIPKIVDLGAGVAGSGNTIWGSDKTIVLTYTWDIKEVTEDFGLLTDDNFIVSNTSVSTAYSGGGRETSSSLKDYSYDANTGILTVHYNMYATTSFYHMLSLKAWVVY